MSIVPDLGAKRKRVLMAMSGGVDSSVAAALLKKQGYEVIGATLLLFDAHCKGYDVARGTRPRSCCGHRAIRDARRVARCLDIPHYVFDFRKDFERYVISDFCAEYARGRTPNPCIRCNQYLKFDLLLKRAAELNADYLATGHYALINCGRTIRLKRPKDQVKDQTYFLYFLNYRQLSRILFPLGELTKPEVRVLARQLGLPVAEKQESQEICFAPQGTYPDFLKARFPELAKSGPIFDTTGRVIGRHPGIIHYTIGQRRRIGLARPEPRYVVAIHPEQNAITVGTEAEVYGWQMQVSEINWLIRPVAGRSFRAAVQIRYQAAAAEAEIMPISGQRARVRFTTPQWAITPGQTAVFYDGDLVLGGGTIDILSSSPE